MGKLAYCASSGFYGGGGEEKGRRKGTAGKLAEDGGGGDGVGTTGSASGRGGLWREAGLPL